MGDVKHLVVLTGAGVSAESGIRTFRDEDGLWENYPVEQVASIEGWYRDPGLMLRFYNERRRQLRAAKPNGAHVALAEAESYLRVSIVTQNVDDLHERAGSTRVLHLHGELTKCRSEKNDRVIYDVEGTDINLGDLAPDGGQLRPHIVWFGEAVPMMEAAIDVVRTADLMAVVGSSLVVYPAASLVHYAPSGTPLFVVDPKDVPVHGPGVKHIRAVASVGVPQMLEQIRAEYLRGR